MSALVAGDRVTSFEQAWSILNKAISGSDLPDDTKSTIKENFSTRLNASSLRYRPSQEKVWTTVTGYELGLYDDLSNSVVVHTNTKHKAILAKDSGRLFVTLIAGKCQYVHESSVNAGEYGPYTYGVSIGFINANSSVYSFLSPVKEVAATLASEHTLEKGLKAMVRWVYVTAEMHNIPRDDGGTCFSFDDIEQALVEVFKRLKPRKETRTKTPAHADADGEKKKPKKRTKGDIVAHAYVYEGGAAKKTGSRAGSPPKPRERTAETESFSPLAQSREPTVDTELLPLIIQTESQTAVTERAPSHPQGNSASADLAKDPNATAAGAPIADTVSTKVAPSALALPPVLRARQHVHVYPGMSQLHTVSLRLFAAPDFQPHYGVRLPKQGEQALIDEWLEFILRTKEPFLYWEYFSYKRYATAIKQSGLQIGDGPLTADEELQTLRRVKMNSLRGGQCIGVPSKLFRVTDWIKATEVWEVTNDVDVLVDQLQAATIQADDDDADPETPFETSTWLADKLDRHRDGREQGGDHRILDEGSAMEAHRRFERYVTQQVVERSRAVAGHLKEKVEVSLGHSLHWMVINH